MVVGQEGRRAIDQAGRDLQGIGPAGGENGRAAGLPGGLRRSDLCDEESLPS